MDVFDRNVVLFENEGVDEGIVVECAVGEDGSLMVLQESYGPLTEWSFGETPHRMELVAEPSGVEALMEYFHVADSWQVPYVLRFECAGFESCVEVQELLQRLGVPFELREYPLAG